jgi:hypothetical protein
MLYKTNYNKMSTITNLQDIPIDKIETDIMSVLYANMDKKFSQYTLFNKVLEDKYDGQYSSQIHSNFKSRFLLVLRNLMSKYDDIKVSKENGIFWVVCLSVSETDKPIEFTKWDNPIKQPVQLDTTDYAHMYNYVYDHNPNDFINWSDPWDGNTIFHELVLTQNKTLLEKLLLQNQFNFLVKNTHGKTPLEMPTSQEIYELLSMNLLQKVILMNERVKSLEEQNKTEFDKYEARVKYLESPDYKNKILLETDIKDIVFTKSSKFYQNYRLYIFSGLICLIAIRYFI